PPVDRRPSSWQEPDVAKPEEQGLRLTAPAEASAIEAGLRVDASNAAARRRPARERAHRTKLDREGDRRAAGWASRARSTPNVRGRPRTKSRVRPRTLTEYQPSER